MKLKKSQKLQEYISKQCVFYQENFNHQPEWKYQSLYHLINELGTCFKERKPSPSKGEKRLCYKNCFNRIMFTSEYDYCEGYALPNIEGFDYPLAHTWLVSPEGIVIDPTWRDENLSQTAYFGIVFCSQYIFDTAEKTKTYGILENQQISKNILRQGFSTDAVKNLNI